jgi:two-component system, NarL family, response regulator DesR
LERIRVLVAEIPQMLRDICTQVVGEQPDMVVVGESSEGMELLMAVGRTGADIVVLGLHDSELSGIGSHLLDAYPHLKVLGLTADGRRAFLYKLRPEKVPIGEVSPQRLLAAIRVAMRS